MKRTLLRGQLTPMAKLCDMIRHALLCFALTLCAGGETVEVSHPRELRGAWVASVSHITWPSRPGLTASEQQAEIVRLLDVLQDTGFNAVFFQVRPEGDALYASELEPWSRFLSGRQGLAPGYDPLRFFTEQAHQRNLEVHAWLNPYRARALPPSDEAFVSPHLAALHPDKIYRYGQFYWMDPGVPEVRERLLDVVRDLTERYPIDGIHFDDYFYPYPENDQEFPDQASYEQAETGDCRACWRRSNVNQAIREVAEAVPADVRFGISPFGIPAPQKPDGISGLDQYEKLYADTQRWMDEGWVDYLAPQLYWPTTQKAQAFEPLLRWWLEHARGGRYVFPGINLAALGSKPAWHVEEFREQFRLARALGAQGSICWNVNPLLEDRAGAQALMRSLYARPALPPPFSRPDKPALAAPQLESVGREVTVSIQEGTPVKAWTVYRPLGWSWQLERIVPGQQQRFTLPAGRWAIAAVSRQGVESRGTTISLR